MEYDVVLTLPLKVISHDYKTDFAKATVLCERTEFVLQAHPTSLVFSSAQTYDKLVNTIAQPDGDGYMRAQEDLMRALLAQFLPTIKPLITHFKPNEPITVHDFTTVDRYSLSVNNAGQVTIDERNAALARDFISQPVPDLDMPATLPRFAASDVVLDTYGPGSTYWPTKIIAGDKSRFFKAATSLMYPEFVHEISTLVKLQKINNPVPHTPHLEGIVVSSDNSTCVMGFLTTWIDGIILADTPQQVRQSKMPEWRATVVETVEALHSHDILWEDVNAHNVMVDRAMRAWVVDLGAGGSGDDSSGDAYSPTARQQPQATGSSGGSPRKPSMSERRARNIAGDGAHKHQVRRQTGSFVEKSDDDQKWKGFEEATTARRRRAMLARNKTKELDAIDAMCDALLPLGPAESRHLGPFFFLGDH